jgi:toxin-antitoxin system PIN domain toxin
VIAVDTNILVYSHRAESRFHTLSVDLLKRLVAGPDTWAIPWPCVYEFFSVVTNHRIWGDRATPPSVAAAQIRFWSRAPNVVLLAEDADYEDTLLPLLNLPRVRGAIVHDARVAALCLSHGVAELYTKDRDFQLFPQLVIRDPLAGPM